MAGDTLRLVWTPHAGASDEDIAGVVAGFRGQGAEAEVDQGVGAFDVEQVILVAGSAVQLAGAIVSLLESVGLRLDLRKRRAKVEETRDLPPRSLTVSRPDGTVITLENPTIEEVRAALSVASTS